MSWAQDFANAKRASIVEVVRENGFELTQESATAWRGVEHDSLVVDSSKNSFYWNSTQQYGDPIDFLMSVMGVESIQQAVRQLNDGKYSRAPVSVTVDAPAFEYRTKNSPDFSRVNDYLTIARGIDPGLVAVLHQKGFIQQDLAGNAVFVWAKNGRRVGASIQGTEINYDTHGARGTAKRIMKDSEANFGFNFSIGKPSQLLVFEAPIDALSYLSMHPKTADTMFLAMDGLKPETVIRGISYMYDLSGEPPSAVGFGVDNDRAGHMFFDKMLLEHQYVVTGTGAALPYFNLIPHDLQISLGKIGYLREVGVETGVDWRDLAAIEKAETNLDDLHVEANGFGFHSAFIEDAGAAYSSDEYTARATELAVALESVASANQRDFDRLVRELQPELGDPQRQALVEKIASYAQQYRAGYEPVARPLKDWNDALRDLHVESVAKEFDSHVYVKADQELVVGEVMDVDGNRSYQAVNRFDQTVGFFEAESPQEMAYLIKVYGYNAVDKQDERKSERGKLKQPEWAPQQLSGLERSLGG